MMGDRLRILAADKLAEEGLAYLRAQPDADLDEKLNLSEQQLAAIIGEYETSLSKVAALAAFIPIVMGMGGNVGTQSSTLIVRGIATGHIDVQRLWQTVGREMLVGLALGAAYGALLSAVAFVLYQNDGVDVVGLGAVVGLSVCASMMIAAVVGSGLPLVFERLSIDPAVATGPFVTTAVDIAGILIYFAFASALLPGLAGAGL